MTWEEWIDSEYDTDGFYIAEDIVVDYEGDCIGYNMHTINPNDVIISNITYAAL